MPPAIGSRGSGRAGEQGASHAPESVESIVRMLELKHKNSLEHASRLEEREADLKKVNPNNSKAIVQTVNVLLVYLTNLGV